MQTSQANAEIMRPPRLLASGITKSFGAVTALSHADLELCSGEVHALLGANGAGKSTIVKIITGVLQPDDGTLQIDGEHVRFASAAAARDAGVAVVFQDPPLFAHLDIAENVFTGAFPRGRTGLLNRREAHDRTRAIMESLGLNLEPGRLVESLSAPEREFVAIARALRRESRVLILDEPTAALSPEETKHLFDVVRRYRDNDGAVLLISHRMDDIREIADRMTIYRDGRTVYTGARGSLTDDQVVEQIMGAAVETAGRTSAGARGADSNDVPVLSVRGLSMRPRVMDVSFDVYPGEIVTLTGLVGAGRTELVETVVGLHRADVGSVAVDGIAVNRRGPRQMARLGIALVPEDRDTQGLIYGFSIAENIAMGSVQEVSRRGILRRREERRIAREQFDALSVRASGIHADVSSLSGGNRQKIVLGKWLATRPRLLILDEPTKGVDVGAKAEIHSILRRLARDQGVAIIVVSSDLDEVLEVSDRILVMRSGRLVAEFSGAEATEVGVMTASATSGLQAAG